MVLELLNCQILSYFIYFSYLSILAIILYLSVHVILEFDLYSLHRSAATLDTAPFQTAPRCSSQTGTPLTRAPLLPEEPSGFFTQFSETLPSSAQDFSDVPLAYKESAFEYFGVTLAREDNRLGVLLPDPDRILEFHFIVLTIENIYLFETCHCQVFLLRLQITYRKVIGQSNRTAEGPAVYYDYVYAIEQGVDLRINQWSQWILVLLHVHYEAFPTGPPRRLR